MLYLLYDTPGKRPSWLLTIAGVVLLTVTSMTAANSVRNTAMGLTGGFAPVSTFVVIFAIVLGLATIALLGLFARELVGNNQSAHQAAD